MKLMSFWKLYNSKKGILEVSIVRYLLRLIFER